MILLLLPLALIDIADLDAGSAAQVTFPSPNDLTKFNVIVTPDSGFWKGATYNFKFLIPDHYVSRTTVHQTLLYNIATMLYSLSHTLFSFDSRTIHQK